MTRTKWTIAIVALVLAFTLPSLCNSAEMAKGLLDGRTFVGETGEKGKDKGDKESFVFQDGTFDPLQCHPYGFGASPYTARKEGESIRFESVTASEKERRHEVDGHRPGRADGGDDGLDQGGAGADRVLVPGEPAGVGRSTSGSPPGTRAAAGC